MVVPIFGKLLYGSTLLRMEQTDLLSCQLKRGAYGLIQGCINCRFMELSNRILSKKLQATVGLFIAINYSSFLVIFC